MGGRKINIKKKTIVFGSLLAVFLLLIIPNVSAITFQTVTNETEQYLHEAVKNTNLDVNEIHEKMKFLNLNEYRDNNNSETFHMLLWILFVLNFGFFTILNLVEGDLLNSLISFVSLILSIVGLKQVVSEPDKS